MSIPKTKHALLAAVAAFAATAGLCVVVVAAGGGGNAQASIIAFNEPSEDLEVRNAPDTPSEEEIRGNLLARLKARTDLAHISLSDASVTGTVDDGADDTSEGDAPAEPGMRTFEILNEHGESVTLLLPAEPSPSPAPYALTSHSIGVSMNGALMPNGHGGAYDQLASTDVLLGYALDGFGIYPDQGSTDLDACHGKVSEVFWEGRMVTMYHYEISAASPQILGCFAGEPVGI